MRGELKLIFAQMSPLNMITVRSETRLCFEFSYQKNENKICAEDKKRDCV